MNLRQRLARAERLLHDREARKVNRRPPVAGPAVVPDYSAVRALFGPGGAMHPGIVGPRVPPRPGPWTPGWYEVSRIFGRGGSMAPQTVRGVDEPDGAE